MNLISFNSLLICWETPILHISNKKNTNKLKRIQIPTLLIWGALDRWIPLDNGKRMDELIPNSKLVVIPNSGHVPMEEHPKKSLKILKSFLGPELF